MQSAGGETVESTTDLGLKFLDSLKQAKDKTYVHLGTHFVVEEGKTNSGQRTAYCGTLHDSPR